MLTIVMEKHSIQIRNAQPEGRALSVNSLWRDYRVDSILTYSVSKAQALIIAADSLLRTMSIRAEKAFNNISLLLFKRRSKRISKHRLVTRKGLLHSNQDGEMFDDKYQANNIPAKRLTEAVHIGVPKPLIDSYCLNKLEEGE